MEIKEIANKNEWEDFLSGCIEKTFLQSWNWGVFHNSMGNKIWRFGVYREGELISTMLVIKISAKRASFLLVPHGPVMKSQIHTLRFDVLNLLKNTLQKLAEVEKVDFIRMCPIFERSDVNNKFFKKLGFRIAPLHYHPESSWKLDIESEEDQLLTQMRKTTRYLIKQAQNNKDIEIFKSTDVKDINVFYKIHQEVVKVQKFVPFSIDYLSKEFLAFLADNQILLSFAKYSPPHQTEPDCIKLGHKLKSDPLWCGGKGKIIAASFEIFWSGIGFYHHAGLLPEYKKLPVSYLLQWEAIKEAKKRNCEVYDFWGYSDPVKYPKHPYSGPTLFKMGFGGHKEEYVKTQDFVISKKYWLNYIIETIRRIKRGL